MPGSLSVGQEEEGEMSNWNLEEVGSHWPVEVGVGVGGLLPEEMDIEVGVVRGRRMDRGCPRTTHS